MISLTFLVTALGVFSPQFAEPQEEVGSENAVLTLRIVESSAMNPTPCRIRLYGPGNGELREHRICDGSLMLTVPPGTYRILIEKGPEYQRVEKWFRLNQGQRVEDEVSLKRLADLSSEGWWSGETHIHLPPDEVALHLLAEDLHVAPLITMWNDRSTDALKIPVANPEVEVEPTRVYHLMNYEHEPPGIGGTSAIYFNLERPIEYDENLAAGILKATEQGGWTEIEKPYIWDTPALLATGQVDSVEIAPNLLSWWLKDDFTSFEELEWGRPRDRVRYPGLRGFGLYVQDLYYRILNSGFRLSATAGTACGFPVQVPVGLGYNRVYVHLGDNFSYQGWWAQLKAGRSFVTNGPLLLVRADGNLPGHTFRTTANNPLDVVLQIDVRGNDPVEAIEIIWNGEVARRITGPDLRGQREVKPPRFTSSGWFLVRAFARIPYNTLSFASTAPFYVEAGQKARIIQPYDAEFFLRWAEERRAMLAQKYSGQPRTNYYLDPHTRAVKYFQGLLRDSERLRVEPVGHSSQVIIKAPESIGDLRLWLPEGIASDSGFSAVYPEGGTWTRQAGEWVQEVSGEEIYGGPSNFRRIDEDTFDAAGIPVPVDSRVEWRTSLVNLPTRIVYTITLKNVGDRTIHRAGAPVCLKFEEADWWEDSNTYVASGGGVRTLEALGRAGGLPRFSDFQAYLLEGLTYNNKFYRDLWGFNQHRLDRPIMVSHNPKSDLCVGITAKEAYFLHSNKGNPCTDIMLAFGDLAPGATARATGQVFIRYGPVPEVLSAAEEYWRGVQAAGDGIVKCCVY